MFFVYLTLYFALTTAFAEFPTSLQGEWSGTQTPVTINGLGQPTVINLSVTGTTAILLDQNTCSSPGCTITPDFVRSENGMCGFYHREGISGLVLGVWSFWASDAAHNNTLWGLGTAFSGGSKIIQCWKVNSSELENKQVKNKIGFAASIDDGSYNGIVKNKFDLAVPIDGSYNGIEGRVSAGGVGATSPIAMTVGGGGGTFKDQFGCTNGCTLGSTYFYDGSAILGYYYDPNGATHGIWFMFVLDIPGTVFAFTTSYQSGYSYVMNWKPTPPCPTTCNSPPTNFGANCGAWIIYRPVTGNTNLLHQSFAYDNNYNSSTPPSLAKNSGYYCCGDDGKSGQCVDCGSSVSDDAVRDLGRVCLDVATNYNLLLSKEGLSSIFPDESAKTCWFLDPSKGEHLDCNKLAKVEASLSSSWNECLNFNAADYSLTGRNCRHYVMAVMQAYCAGSTQGPCSC